jgi:hypothetical protein
VLELTIKDLLNIRNLGTGSVGVITGRAGELTDTERITALEEAVAG